MNCLVTKPTKWHVHLAKTQISLGNSLGAHATLLVLSCHGSYGKNKKIWMPEKIAIIIPEFDQCGFTIEYCVQKMQTE